MTTNNDQGGGWLADRKDDAEFQKLCAREEFVESFLADIEEAMQTQGVNRKELATRMGCEPANITQIMRRTRNLTAKTMVDMAHALGMRLRLRTVLRQAWEVLECDETEIIDLDAHRKRAWVRNDRATVPMQELAS